MSTLVGIVGNLYSALRNHFSALKKANVAIHAVDRRLARDGAEDLAANRGASRNEDPIPAVVGRAITDAQRALRNFRMALTDSNTYAPA